MLEKIRKKIDSMSKNYYFWVWILILLFAIEVRIIPKNLEVYYYNFYPMTSIKGIESFILFFTFYQIFVFFILKLYDDIKKRELNNIKALYELVILVLDSHEKSHKRIKIECCLKKKIERKKEITSYPNEILHYYENLEKFLEEDNLFEIKWELIKINNSIDNLDLKFRHSFIIRFILFLIKKEK